MRGGPFGGAGTLTVHRTTGLTCSRLSRFFLSLCCWVTTGKHVRRPKCVDVCSEPSRSPFWLMFSVCDPYGGIVLFLCHLFRVLVLVLFYMRG